MPEPIESPHQPASGREIALVTLLLGLALACQVMLAAGKVVFVRSLWIDETFTQSLASSPSIGYMIEALKHGVEVHMPTAYVLMRWFSIPFGGVTPLSLRLFAFLSVVAAMGGVYATLRLAFARGPALIGVLAV